MLFADRSDAGRRLAPAVAHRLADRPALARQPPVVLGLPRGGVPVAAEVARELGAPLDVLVVRKLGLPGQPELAMGAIAGVAGDVEVVRNDAVLALAPVGEEAFRDVYAAEVAELRRRESAYRGDRPPAEVAGRTTVVVDDGLATGSTMRAAVAAVRHGRPAAVVVAVPVGSRDTCARLAEEVDELVCLTSPRGFAAVGQVYVDFSPTTDDEVRRALAEVPRVSGPVVPAAAQRVGGLLLPRAVAGHPALELCNTLAGWGEDGPGEYLTTYDHLAVWSATVGLVPTATARRLRRGAAQAPDRAADALADGRALRADLYAVLTRPRPPRPALDRLTERVRDAGAASRVGWSRSAGLGLEPGSESLDLPVRAFATAARRLVEDGLAGRVRRCPGAGCGWLFLDEGRGRRWCVMAVCGNREKARRYARRHG